ncbi:MULTISPECIES: SprT family zinc-dependent metalloprotease [Marinomonas]|uniref:SprT family zinc-dependent metalloprotease n=1 Tax=Marinomonas TaxID=28253 RepID=UPI0010569821|nr:SprT family zinc-dependent metalloprotease [Marinomonas sp. KMM3893]
MLASRQQQPPLDLDDSASLAAQIQHKVTLCMQQADVFFGKHFDPPSCNLKQRGRAAGTAHLHKNEVRFNLFMLQQNTALFLETVVPHEVAHIIVYQIYGHEVRPHGKEWQAVMKKVFHLEPNRTHNFEVPLPKKAFRYQCQCQIHTFTAHRHNRAKKGTEYICKLCRSPLYFLKE